MKKQELKKRIREIAKENGLKVRFFAKNNKFSGYYRRSKGLIAIADSSTNHMVDIFCHEIGHYMQYEEQTKLQRKFFSEAFGHRCTREIARNVILPFEQEADWIGSKLKLKLFPDISKPFKFHYKTPDEETMNKTIDWIMRSY